MSRALTRWLPAVLVVLVVLCTSVSAQSGTAGWSEPVVLTPSEDALAWRPELVADPLGHLHAIWSEGTRAGSTNHFDAIYYASWDGKTWSAPVDVLADASGKGMSDRKGLIATAAGLVVIAWSEDNMVLVASAPIATASSARSWRTVEAGNGANPALAASAGGEAWYLAYWRDTRTLVVSESDDEGDNWTDPKVLWAAAEDSAGSNVSAETGIDGTLHLVWTENTSRRTWSGEAIWHAAIDANTGIAEVREVSRSEQPDEPTLDGANIAACPNGQLHIVWNNGVGSETGRFHQWWNPDTGPWSQVAAIFPGLSGQTSKPGLVCDATGRVHLVTGAQAASPAPAAGLRYATWQEGQWSDYETLWQGNYAGERISAAIVHGNELHLAWNFYESGGSKLDRLVHAHTSIAAPELEPLVPSAVVAKESPGPTSTPEKATGAVSPDVVTTTATSTTQPHEVNPDFSPLVLSVAVVMPVIALALWLSTRSRRL